jgi:hypothetical protein
MLGLAQRMAQISSFYSGYLQQFQKQVTMGESLKRTIAESIALERSVLGSAQSILKQSNQFVALTPRMDLLFDANRELARIVGQIGLPTSTLSAAFASQSGAHHILVGAGLSKSLTASFMQMDRSRMLSASLLAQEKLAVLDGVPWGSLVGADVTFRRSTAAHLGRLTRSYRDLVAAMANRPALVSRLTLVTAYPPIDYYRHIRTIESVSTSVADTEGEAAAIDASLDEAVPSIDDLLRQFDNSLLPLIMGARQSLSGKNPDRARHVTTSLRELLTRVIHALAPDDDVKSWTRQSDLYQGGPSISRRERLLYLCRNINEGVFTDFLRDDVSATLSFIDLLNAGTHTVESQLTPAQLRLIVKRAESMLIFLLEIRNDG